MTEHAEHAIEEWRRRTGNPASLAELLAIRSELLFVANIGGAIACVVGRAAQDGAALEDVRRLIEALGPMHWPRLRRQLCASGVDNATLRRMQREPARSTRLPPTTTELLESCCGGRARATELVAEATRATLPLLAAAVEQDMAELGADLQGVPFDIDVDSIVDMAID